MTAVKKALKTVLTVILAVVFLSVGGMLVLRLCEGYAARQDHQQAVQLAAVPEVEPTPEPTPIPVSTPQPTYAPAVEPTPEPVPEPTPRPAVSGDTDFLAEIDLDALRQTNPDVVGWIAIPGTELSYPLMQGEDNQYYLTHSWTKKKSAVGSIYLDYRNSEDMSDFNSIIYGHRMSDGSMFNSLRHYKDQSYWEEHPSIYIVTDEGILCYDVFSAYEADAVNGSTYRLGLEEAKGQQAYINYCSRRSVVESDVAPQPGDHIITLSTCVSMGAQYDTRWVVQAVRSGNTP